MDKKSISYVAVALIGLVVLLGLAYVFGPQATDTSQDEAVEPGNNTIIISHDKFNPTNTTVKVGTTVTWTNKDWDVNHTIIGDSPNAQFESPVLTSGNSFTYTFNQTGTYAYHDKGKPNSNGVIVVEG